MIVKARTAAIWVAFLWPALRLEAQAGSSQLTGTDPVDQAISAQNTNGSRTVMATEYGSIFVKPDGFPASDFGAYMGAGPHSTALNPQAIKGRYSHFQHFGPGLDVKLGFPYAALRNYEATEIAAGRPPIFITATFKGKKRPVINIGSLKLDSTNHPTSDPSTWIYPVNVQDERFIKFFVTQYVRPVILEPMASLGNVWVYSDGANFTYSNYGVLDDNNQFFDAETWDPPFPQNGLEYELSVGKFFDTLSQKYPDVKMIIDTGSLPDPSKFSTVYANVSGVLTENVLFGWRSNPNMLNAWSAGLFSWYQWAGNQGKVTVLGASLSPNYMDDGDLLLSFSIYELLKGPNSFFAPRAKGTAIPLTAPWQEWSSKLGTPVSDFQSKQLGAQPGNRLFWRKYSNGYVYLNWTGTTQTVTLPAGTWFDPNDNKVTKLTIPTLTGTFVNR